jgi:iron complex outermembrane receptor protein
MKRNFMLCLALLLYGWVGYTQELEIHGSIEDEHGRALENIIVKLIDQDRFTETDQQGEFVILANEGSKVSLSHLAYRPKTVVLSNHMQIIMQEQAFDLDNIIVTADPFGNLAQSRIVYDDIKAVTQPRNVSDLFKDIPGFGILKRGAYASEPVFRAFKYEQLNVQYDGGMKILNACPNRMDPITTHVIPEEIERIEVVKGPFTVRFGQNFGGIINLVSKTPDSKEDGISGTVETGYETNGNNFTGRGAVMYKKERFDLELNGSYRNYGDYTDGNGEKVPSSFTSTDYSVKLGINPTEEQRLRLTWRQSFGRDIKHAGLPMDSPYDNSYLMGLDYKIRNISNTISSIMFKGFYSNVDHLMTNEERPNFMMVGASSNVFVTTWGGKAEMTLNPGDRLSLFLGLDANIVGREGDRIRTIKMMNGNMLPEPIVKVDKIWQDSKLNDVGLFAESKFRTSERSTFTAGIRTDFISTAINDPEQDFLDLYGGEIDDQQEVNFSGNVSYVYSVNKTMLQFSYGHGVRTAAIVERYINHFNVNSDPYEYVGNPYLNPEKNDQFEISVNQKFEKIDLGATVFYSFLTDYITAVVDESLPRKFMPMLEPKFAKRFINVDKANQAGFELYFNVHFTESLSFLSDLAYTYGQNQELDEPLPQIVPLTGHLSLNYDKDNYWINLKSRLVAEQNRISTSFGETVTPGFATFDLSAGLKPFKGFSVGAAVLNIFDTDYYEHLNFSYRNSDLLNGRIYEPGRNFTLYVTYSF